MSNKVKVLLIGFLLLANVFVFKEVFSLNNNLQVIFFDVGQGDSIFIETPQRHQILIDGGPSQSIVLEKLSRAMPFFDKTIDLIVLTHPDFDHLNGLLGVLENYKVANVLWLGTIKDNKTNQVWLRLLEQEKAKEIIAKKGTTITASETKLFVLHPFEELQGVIADNKTNESSIVLKLVFGQNSFLFTGDISKKEENVLSLTSSLPVSLQSDILKVAHHGSKTSANQSFIEIVAPQVAVISCGQDNSYGHPHSEVLSILEQFAIKVKRTDQQGSIKIASDGISLSY